MGVLNDIALEAHLAALHAANDRQLEQVRADYETLVARGEPLPEGAELAAYFSDKLAALDRDKAEFCYQLCRAINARYVVEVGTSHGVSTHYLAAAVRDNHGSGSGRGRVIGTEYEVKKAAAARKNLEDANLSPYVEIREGDLRETLNDIAETIDFVLVDVWTPMARPAIECVYPRLRSGAIVVCDNTGQFRDDYADYLAFLSDPARNFRTMTLPFQGGLELSVRL